MAVPLADIIDHRAKIAIIITQSKNKLSVVIITNCTLAKCCHTSSSSSLDALHDVARFARARATLLRRTSSAERPIASARRQRSLRDFISETSMSAEDDALVKDTLEDESRPKKFDTHLSLCAELADRVRRMQICSARRRIDSM